MFMFISLLYKIWQECHNGFGRWENQGTEKLNNFPRTQLEVTCAPVQTLTTELSPLGESTTLVRMSQSSAVTVQSPNRISGGVHALSGTLPHALA